MKPITGPSGKGDDGKAGVDGDPAGGGLFKSRRRSRSSAGGSLTWQSVLANPVAKGVLAGFGGLLLGYIVATVVLFPAAAQQSGLLVTPNFLGQDLTSATTDAEELGLEVGPVDTIRHPRAASGTVLGQNPLPGQFVAAAGLVKLTVSAGPVSLPVPPVVGRQLTQATDLLDAAGFTFEVDTIESESPAGSVVESDPAPGERVSLPQMVHLQVSLGPPLVTLPRVIGMDELAAVQLLDSLGIEVSEIEERFRFGLDQGKIIEQEPAAGVTVEHGSAVRLVVGRRGGD
ncbi:MAG: PASTA domain-containing protein [Gemmatimonadota bacterium]|nr:PASTA domain-containing protein [Gemmatimonadota bacterium]